MSKQHQQNQQQHQQRNPEDRLIYFIENNKRNIFFAILIVAFLIRIQKINNGLPYILNPTESGYLSDLLALIKNPFKIHSFNEPSLFLALNSIILFITSGTVNVSNLVNALESNPQALFIPLRIVSILFGVGTIALTFLIGDLFGSLCGIFASAFLAVCFLHLKYCQVFSPFIPMLFFILLTVLFSLKAYYNKEESLKLYFFAMIFALLSASMHYVGIFSILLLIFVMSLNKDTDKIKTHIKYFAILFLALNPYVIFSLVHFLMTCLTRYMNGFDIYPFSSYLNFFITFLLQGLGPVVYCTAFFFLKYKNNFDKNSLKIVFFLPLFYIAILGFMHITQIPYAVLIAPFFCLASGMFFESFANEYPDRRFALIVLLLFALWVPFKYSDKHNRITSLSDTRVIATEWIHENITEDYSVAYDKNSVQVDWFDPYKKDVLKNIVDDPDILSNPIKFEVTEKLLKRKNWFSLMKKKVDYVVIDSIDEEKAFRKPNNFLQKKYYIKFQQIEPTIVFNPYLKEYDKKIKYSVLEDLYSPFESLWHRERTGPIIKIYKI